MPRHLGDLVHHRKWRSVGEITACHIRLDKAALALQPGRSEDGDMLEKTPLEGQVILQLVAAQRRGFFIGHL